MIWRLQNLLQLLNGLFPVTFGPETGNISCTRWTKTEMRISIFTRWIPIRKRGPEEFLLQGTSLHLRLSRLVYIRLHGQIRIYFGLNDRDAAWHDLYALSLSDGHLTRHYTNTDRMTGYIFDWADTLRGFYQTDEKGNTEILYKEGRDLKSIFKVPVSESASVVGWTPENEEMYMVTNQGERDLLTLCKLHPESGEVKDIESDPENRVDLNDVMFHRHTREIISTIYTDEKERVYWKDEKWAAYDEELQENFQIEKYTSRAVIQRILDF